MSNKEKRMVFIWGITMALGITVFLISETLRPVGMFICGHASGFAFRGIAQSNWGSA